MFFIETLQNKKIKKQQLIIHSPRNNHSYGRTGPFSLPAAYGSLNRPDSESDFALEDAKGWVCQGSRPRVPARPGLAGKSTWLGGGEG